MLPLIEVENLGKRYWVSHIERGSNELAYHSLRDDIAESAKRLFRPKRGGETRPSGTSREEFWALQGVSFQVSAGDRIGVVGRNGAGKSTLLKLLSRITEPSKGRIHLRGRIATLLEVGTGFHPELTGRENVFLNGAILGMHRPEIQRKFDEIVAFAEVERFLDTPVKRYSSGMHVRLAFAIAAHLEPEVLILDEVLAVGDARFRQKCLGKMEEVGQAGHAVLFVSHNMSTISRFCNRGIFLECGETVGIEDVSTCIQKYLETGSGHGERIFPPKGGPHISYATVESNGEELTIQATVINGHLLKDAVLGFAVCDVEGIAMVGTDARFDSQDLKPMRLQSERSKITVRMTQPSLRTGRYFLSLYLGDVNTTCWRAEQCISFEVVNQAELGLTDRPKFGSILPVTSWQATALKVE